jgi:subtilisin family serine protease
VEVVDIPENSDPLSVAKSYVESGLVEFAEPDYRIHAADVPNDPGFLNCWGLNNTGQRGGTPNADIGAEAGWDNRNSAEDVIVAVLDSGVRYTHEDLAANMWHNPKETGNGKDDDGNGIADDIYGYNAFASSGDPWDDFGHGTHVSGTIGAVGNNGKGVAGVCWKVKIMALKFMDSDGYGDTSDAIACINYARKNGAKVINASWGSSANSTALRNAINSARSAGIIFVTAAGNDASNNDRVPSYPASFNLDNVITVAALDEKGNLDSSYSNWGAKSVDLAAPGTMIYSTSGSGDDQYQYMSGTSMATPHVTGAVALLRAAYPTESYTNIIKRLFAGVEKVPSLSGKCVTGGRLNIAKLFPRVSPSAYAPPAVVGVEMTSAQTIRLTLASASSGQIVESSTNLRDWVAESGAVQNGNIVVLPFPTEAHHFYRVRQP